MAKVPDPGGINLREFHDNTVDSALQCREIEERWKVSKAQTADLKKQFDSAVQQHLQLTAEEAVQQTPLFEDSDQEPAEPEKDPDDWKPILLSTMDIKPATLKKLEEVQQITTLGNLIKWQAEHTTDWVKDLKGIGPAAGTEIDEAVAKFWADHEEAEKDQTPYLELIKNGDDAGQVELAIHTCDDLDLLTTVFSETEDDWRSALLDARMKALEANIELQAEYDQLIGDDRELALTAIEFCDDVQMLQRAHGEGKGDWRRAAILKKIQEIKDLAEAQD
jgi:hypothetical protein